MVTGPLDANVPRASEAHIRAEMHHNGASSFRQTARTGSPATESDGTLSAGVRIETVLNAFRLIDVSLLATM